MCSSKIENQKIENQNEADILILWQAATSKFTYGKPYNVNNQFTL